MQAYVAPALDRPRLRREAEARRALGLSCRTNEPPRRPLDFPEDLTPRSVTGISLWLRGDLGISLGGGGGVSGWADQSGLGDPNRNASQATAALQPGYTAANALVGNRPTVDCTMAAGFGRHVKTGTWAAPTIASDITLFFVARRANTCINNRYLYDGIDATGAVQFAAYEDNAGGAHDFYNTGGGNYMSRVGDLTNQSAIIIGAKNGQPATLHVNSTASIPTTAADPAAFTPGGLTIGCYEGTGPYSDFEVAEVAVWLRQLTAAEINFLNAYAHGRYGMVIA